MSVTEDDFVQIGPWRGYRTDYRGAVILPVDPTGRVLLQLRDRNPEAIHPGEWGFFGGAAEEGESLMTAVRREFHEETGLNLPEAAFSPFARIVSPVSQRRLYVFEAKLPSGPSAISLNEGAGFGFFTPPDIARLDLIGAVRIVLSAWTRRSQR